jgi:PhoH-like ATPase
VIQNELNPKAIALGRFDGEVIVSLNYLGERPSDISPRSITQKFMQEALMTNGSQQRLVLFEGPAGTAKTFYTLAVGLWAKEKNLIDKFNVTRANVEADKSFGFLPGNIDEKFEGFLNPIYDNLRELMKIDRHARYKDGRTITDDTDKEYLIKEVFGIQPITLNYMRGRHLPHRFIFVDEAQNLDRAQAKMVVTRAGEGTVVILAGDVSQIDDIAKVNKFSNGLTHAIRTMVGDPHCYYLRLQNDDNQRSNLSHAAATKM